MALRELMEDPEEKLTPGRVGLAFGLVIGAGLCTVLGSLLSFFVTIQNTSFLAASLGVSAGVMLYVSFGEIFTTKAVDGFIDHGFSEDEALRYATFSFFGGIAMIWALDWCIHTISHYEENQSKNALEKAKQQADTFSTKPKGDADVEIGHLEAENGSQDQVPPLRAGQDQQRSPGGSAYEVGSSSLETSNETSDGQGGIVSAGEHPQHLQVPRMPNQGYGEEPADSMVASQLEEKLEDIQSPRGHLNAQQLRRMGLLTALAVGLHNLPEGLATFIGAIASPTAGVAIALAIALHNIPEGVCVAMPVYYASGSRFQSILWAFLSGVAEPLGGVLGYLIIRAGQMNDLVFGLLFGLVGGMMVYISLKELIPTALKFDKKDKVTTLSIVFGMAIMAASLLVFALV